MVSGVLRHRSIPPITRYLLKWSIWVLCVTIPALLLIQAGIQFVTPPPPPRLMMERDIPLPDALPDLARTAQNPFAPGIGRAFDRFDFQAIDPEKHLLFIAHSGPAPDREQQVNPKFDPDKDAKTDGNVVVFNTQQQKIVGLLTIPQVAGITVAADLNKVYAADNNDSIIYVIDEKTLQTKQIPLQANDGPDGIWYEQASHLLFVSNPGAPSNPDTSNAIDRKNQNETIIDTLTDKIVGRVLLGTDGKWGDDVGHVRTDPQLQQAYVTIQQNPDLDSLDPNLSPPAGKAWLVAIDTLKRTMVSRLLLPVACITPHGMAIDTNSHIAFLACVDSEPAILLRVDLRKMQVIKEDPWPVETGPDMIMMDRPLHLLYVASASGITLFRENGRDFQWIGSYTYGFNTHSLAVNEQTHEIYIPLPRMGGRPELRIMRYNTAHYS